MRGSISSRGTTAQTAEETSQVRAVRNAPGTKKYHDSPTSVLEDPGGAWPENSNTSSRSIWSSSSSEALLSPKSEDESAESDRDTSEYSDSDHEDCKPTKKLKTQEGQKKLSRNKNPGRRIIGGRVYDSVLGETCHWCRQKTVEDHVACCNCSIKFCGLCLRNRHGENIDDERRKSVQWVCPKCRGGCGPGCSNWYDVLLAFNCCKIEVVLVGLPFYQVRPMKPRDGGQRWALQGEPFPPMHPTLQDGLGSVPYSCH